MLYGWIIYRKKDAKKNESYIQWFIEEAKKQEIELELVLREEMTIGIKDNRKQILIKQREAEIVPDFAVVRTREPLLNNHLESMGLTTFNSAKVSRICNDKAYTHHYIHQLEIPMADTLYYTKDIFPPSPPLSYPVVVKEVHGHGGKEVYYIENNVQWQKVKEIIRSDFIVQTADVQLGKDLRVFIVGNEIAGAVLRSNEKDFRANYTLGGTAALYELKEEEIKLIQRIINSLPFGMVGIDFLLNHEGRLLFNEIEDVVGSRTLSKVSDINILEKYVSYIKQVVKTES